MEPWSWLHAVDVAFRCVSVAFVAHMWLVPWTLWTLRRAACWTRWALSRGGVAADGPENGRRQPSTCACCGGVDFDGMVGRWAVVTGCTDGIGKEYALQLADRGMNIALVSRNLSKLQAVAEEINGRYGRDGVRTRIIVADFTSRCGTASLTSVYDGVRRSLDGLDVAVLVNNAGVCYARPDKLLDLPPCCSSKPSADGDPIRDVIECNVLAAVAMCRIVMPAMMATAAVGRCNGGGAVDRGPADGPTVRDGPEDGGDNVDARPLTVGGVVVNVSSCSATGPCPLLSVYGASKAFLYKFSTELAAEHDDQPLGGSAGLLRWRRRRLPPRIAVRCLTTGFVATKMSRMRPATAGVTWIPSPGLYACHSLRALACHCGCRLLRNDRRARTGGGNTGAATGDGKRTSWLAGAASVIFDSPSSPFSACLGPITTTGFTVHTIMIHVLNAAMLLLGEEFVSGCIYRILAVGRDRIVRRDGQKIMRNTVAKEEEKDQSNNIEDDFKSK